MTLVDELRAFCVGNPPSDTIAAWLRERIDTVMLSMSTGKDSLAAWSLLRAHRFTVIPVFEAKIPGLSFIDDTIRELEDHFETHVYRTLSDSFPRWLNGGFLQPLHRMATIAALEIPEFHRDDVTAHIAACRGVEPILITGVRSADSTRRAMNHRRTGIVRPGRHGVVKLDLVHDWKIDRVRQVIADERIPYSDFEYRHLGRTFDAVNFQHLEPIRTHRPDDWDIVRFWFPFCDIAIDRQLIPDREPYRMPDDQIPTLDASIPNLGSDVIPDLDEAPATDVRSLWDLPEVADTEISTEVEVRHIANELVKADRKRDDDGRSSIGYLHDGGYYAQLVFRSSGEAEAFVRGSGARLAGALDPMALDGAAVAARLGITLPAQPKRYAPKSPPSLPPRRFLMGATVRADRVPLVLPEF